MNTKKSERMTEIMQALTSLNVGSYITSEEEQKRFKRTILDTINYNPALQDVPVESIIECSVKGASLKLELNRHYNMVPRSERKGEPKKAKFELTYQGYLTLLDRAGILGRANVVYEKDSFDIDLANETISHKPFLRGSRGQAIGVYAIIDMDGHRVVDYMSWEEVQNFKKKYLAFVSPAWQKSETEMAKKTILKRTAKPYIHTDTVDDSLREAQSLDNSTETSDGATLESRDEPAKIDEDQELLKFIRDEADEKGLISVQSQLKTDEQRQAWKARIAEIRGQDQDKPKQLEGKKQESEDDQPREALFTETVKYKEI